MQIRTARVVLVLLAAMFAGSWTFGETFYITIPEKAAAAPPKQSDITLILDKKPVPVTEFLTVDASSRSPQLLHHPAGRRQYVLVFDLIFSKPDELVQGRRTATSLISKLGKEDLAAVAVFSKLYGLRFWSGLTNDRDKLNMALNAIGLDKVPGAILGPDGNLYPEDFAGITHSADIIPEAEFVRNIVAAQAPPDEKDQKKMNLLDPPTLFITSLNSLAYSLAGVQGPKTIVLISPGFDVSGAKIKMEEKGFTDAYVDAATIDPQPMSEISREEQRALTESDRRKEKERAFQSTPLVQVEGIPEFVAGTSCSVVALSPGAQEYSFFKNLTTVTGGFYLRNSDELPAASDRILDLHAKYYIIGFDGKREKQFRELHSLKLETAQKALRTSSSWVPPRSFDQYSPLERRLHVSEAEYKDFLKPEPGQKFWADSVFQRGPRVALFSQIPGAWILKHDVDQYSLEAYGFLLGEDGRIVDYSLIPVRFDLKNKQLRERLNKAGVKVWSMILGGKGPGTVRWVLVDSQFGDTTTWSEPIDIQDSELTTSYPFIPSTNFDWVVWPKPQDTQNRRGAELKYPYAVGADLFFPELGPDINKSDTDKVVYFRIYNRIPEMMNPPIHMYLVDAAGKQTEIQQFALLQKPGDLEQSGVELFWKLMALPDVPQGSYRLRVSVRDAVKKKDVVREMQLEIK